MTFTFVLGVVGVITLCLSGLFLQAWIEPSLESRKNPDPMKLSKPTLGIVLPLSAEDMAHAVESLRCWPKKCSQTTLSRMDVIFLFAGEIPHDFDIQVREISESMSCFKTTKAVSSALRSETNSSMDIRSAQFYKMFLAPDVREHFLEYDALVIMDSNFIIAHEKSFERLYSATFTGEPFWVKGSCSAGTIDHDEVSSEKWHYVDHLDGNAIYNNTDGTFFDFINFTLERSQLTRPYDEALWSTLSDFPYSWPLWQRYSSNFVVTGMIRQFKDQDAADNSKHPDTIFLRRTAKRIGGRSHKTEREINGCYQACENTESDMKEGVVSAFCNVTCIDGHLWVRFGDNPFMCGAGEHLVYEKACKMCSKDHQVVLEAEKAVESNINLSTPYSHVIMCDTKQSPEVINACSRECNDMSNTVCDGRCGTGQYGDWHCNWRNLGNKCRYCFHDVSEARRADKIAREAGGRVVMCKTHEVPPEPQHMARITGIRSIIKNGIKLAGLESNVIDNGYLKMDENPAAVQYIGDIFRRNICIFIPGYFEFFHEVKHAVTSIQNFMPGVKVVIATHPMDYHVYHRGIGKPDALRVFIVNDTRVAYSSLAADMYCGKEIRLIYYMNPGEVLSRPFTARDTHTPTGELLVEYRDADFSSGEHLRRTMGTTAVLGFHGLSFTYNTDLILPVEINAKLRVRLQVALGESGAIIVPDETVDGFKTRAFYDFFDSILTKHSQFTSVFIPELLAALLFIRNPVGVQFINTAKPRVQYSAKMTIWDVPLVKPRFGCSVDLSLTLKGYDVAHQLEKHVEAFKNGARCNYGFIPIDSTIVKLKAEWEFPAGYPISRMPSLRDYRISVMYRTFSGDAELFDISLSTAIKHISEALEIVVVVEEDDEDIFEQLLASHRRTAPYPLRLVTEPAIMNGHIQQKYSKMRADLYTEGNYILHLDSDVLVLRDVTYEDIFHLGKPVLPFRRYRNGTKEGEAIILCWQNGTSFAIGEDVVHEFSIFNTHVYPREMYASLRKFIEEKHGKSFSDFMSTRVGKCSSVIDLVSWTADKRSRLLSDFNLMGAFLWYHMPDVVYWMAADPYDLRPDQWRINLSRYEWVCQANGRSLPKDIEGKRQFKTDFLSATNSQQCNSVYQQWANPEMKNPATRSIVLKPA